MTSAEHVSVAVDYYRLLHVPRVSRPDAIRKAYENLVKQPPAAAYSADTLFARAVLLKAAAESLTDPDLRRSYDAKLAAGHTALRVSQQDLPGALVVLQEIGEYQLVLDLGLRWLEVNGGQPDAGDVAAAVALAYCDRASERLTSQLQPPPPSALPGPDGAAVPHTHVSAVLPACDDLDAALSKLRRYGMAQQLQQQIVSALRDLAPEYACELAALPLGAETAARRAKGVALMRGVLRAAATVAAATAKPEAAADDSDEDEVDPRSVLAAARRMLTRSRDVLTCSEQVALLPDALRGSGVVPTSDALYDGALARLVDGFRNGWPHSVHEADQLLAKLEAQQARAAAIRREQAELAAAAAARRAMYSGPAAANGPTLYTNYNNPAVNGIGAGAPPPPPPMPMVPRGDGQHAMTASVAAHVHSTAMAEHAARSAAGGAGGASDGGAHANGVALERAVCAILLGDYTTAVERLGLDTTAAAAAAPETEQLRDFVLAHSPSGRGDLRPGLRALATRWLEGVALASFRDTAGSPVPPLEATWFADLRVAFYLQVWRLCRVEQVLVAAHFLANLLPNLLKAIAGTAVKVAANTAVAASRAQRLSAAVAASAVPAASASATRASRPGTLSAAAAAAHAVRRQQANAVGASIVGADVLPPTAVAAAAAAGTAAAAAVGGPALSRGAGASSSTYEEEASEATDLRRRFSASSRAAAAAPVASAATAAPQHGAATAASASHAHQDEEDPHDHQEAGVTRRMSEADLRAHLAGLEKAMWDSELPPPPPSRAQKALTYAAGLFAMVIAFLAFNFFRRTDGGPSALVPATVTATSVAANAQPTKPGKVTRSAH
ncbi:hypothetical protein HYH02_002856 [Chlamydomonas schloesseri]|uniref:J domain-containing protein n=1 Tax=Chlamydomonas schloesseri TaxID=2026947 RepID=A0A836BB58_9CHLO|nr:hypothetical protein HYH02_002856 [Chlamydomonas schloesseri]|eukprot:KAG2452619.1 hypothetical protein HYH02_002856 [Chlamydomonas schloesseri]